MEYEIIRGYKVVHSIDPEKARNLVDFYLDCGVMCVDKDGNETHPIVTINNIRICFKYEGMKREHIEIKELKKKSNLI